MNEVGKTMGYAKDDIQDALGKGKPNRQFAWLVGGCIVSGNSFRVRDQLMVESLDSKSSKVRWCLLRVRIHLDSVEVNNSRV